MMGGRDLGPSRVPGARLVGRRLPGVNLGDIRSKVLGDVAAEVALPPAAPQPKIPHIPAIAQKSSFNHDEHTTEGLPLWGVFCLACSEEAQEYIYPCKQNWLGRWDGEGVGWPPPAELIEPDSSPADDAPSTPE